VCLIMHWHVHIKTLEHTFIRVLHCVAACCSVLQCVAVCCSVLQCVAVCCSGLQRVAVPVSVHDLILWLCLLSSSLACSGMQHTAIYCNTLQHAPFNFLWRGLANDLPETAASSTIVVLGMQHAAIH